MPTINITLSKVYTEALRALPLLALLGTSIMWVDTRYMHKEISDTRFIEIQIKIVERNIRDYHRMIEEGVELSPSEKMELEMEQDQLKFLRNERNKVLDLGGLPE